MALGKNLIAWALGLVVLVIGGNAQAEVITYSFTADIVRDSDPTNVIGVSVGDTVSGTFSFDTDAPSVSGNLAGGEIAYSDTGTIETDAVVISGGNDARYPDGTTVMDDVFNMDELVVVDGERRTSVTNLSTGVTVDARYAVQSVTFYFGDSDALSSADLPESLNLDDFRGAQYVVKVKLTNGQIAYAKGDITSLTRVDGSSPSAVPELSASGAASSLAVLLGGAYVITTRRREGVSAT